MNKEQLTLIHSKVKELTKIISDATGDKAIVMWGVKGEQYGTGISISENCITTSDIEGIVIRLLCRLAEMTDLTKEEL